MPPLEEWQAHIRRNATQAYCGHVLTSRDWAFVDKDHAREAIQQQTRMQPAPCCITEIDKESAS